VLDMVYRYVFLFIKIFEERHLGLKTRLVKGLEAARTRRWIASQMGYVFKRSMKMSEEVYLAMLARGYTGDIKDHGR
jgi:energy-coupling factor transporter transmembrane protein EcfT